MNQTPLGHMQEKMKRIDFLHAWRKSFSTGLLLAIALFSPVLLADTFDLGALLYEINSDLQQPAPIKPPADKPLPAPISFDCATGTTGLACSDSHHLRYNCTDYGASGQYCKRQDGKAWIHCSPEFFHSYHCAVISTTSDNRSGASGSH